MTGVRIIRLLSGARPLAPGSKPKSLLSVAEIQGVHRVQSLQTINLGQIIDIIPIVQIRTRVSERPKLLKMVEMQIKTSSGPNCLPETAPSPG